jgi:hypothetical protein
MARISTPAIWLPGFLNACNSASSTGAGADAAGNPYFQGLNPGKMIVLGTNEAQNAAAPGTTLYDGSYQWVQLDSGATAANATLGMPAFILLDSGATQGAQPETAYNVPTVTTADRANTLGLNPLFCGVFINPATISGVANGPTPGNWTMIFVGAGRVQCNYAGAATLAHVAAPTGGGAATFTDSATAPTNGSEWGQNVQAIGAAGLGLVYFPEIIFRFGGF